MEITAILVEEGFRTGNILKHTVVNKGLPGDAKLINAKLNSYGNLELRFESEKQEGDEKHIYVELTTMTDV